MKVIKITQKIEKQILKQAQEEVEFAREHKKPRLSQWKRTENQYYGVKPSTKDNRSNVMLPKMQGFVDTLLSKVDAFPNIKFMPGEDADTKKAERIKALFDQDARPANMNFAFKDTLGKKQAILYGRAIYEFHASSKGGYKAHLTLIDAYDFLIDPAAGGIDTENADYLGRQNLIKNREELEQGAKDGKYIKAAVKRLLANVNEEDDNAGTESEDEQDKEKKNRYAALNVGAKRRMLPGTFKFIEWYTTFKGCRFYLLFNEDSGEVIRLEKLKDMFNSELWPFWSWATYPDLVEFWSPAPADMVRDIFAAQTMSINQMLDNNEEINRPMIAFDTDVIDDPVLLKYRRDGLVPLKKGTNIRSAVQMFEKKPINNGIAIYETLEGIQELESGVTSASKGAAGEEKVGIYEGNLANVSDRLGLLNKSYANAYHRFALLYQYGIREHLNKKTAIKMIGPDGVEFDEITKTDITPRRGEYDIFISASDAERNEDILDKRSKLGFVSENRGNKRVNQSFLIELEAEIAGFTPDQIARLMDTEDYGSKDLLAEAQRDIQLILDGKEVEPNQSANTAYVKKIVEYVRDKHEGLTEEQELKLLAYIDTVMPIVERNMVDLAVQKAAMAGAVVPPLNQVEPTQEEVPQEQPQEEDIEI